MSLSINNWNIEKNIVWFVRLSDTGTSISVELYLTQADALAQTNMQASGESSGYGADLAVILSNEGNAETLVSFFQDEYSWHLIVSGENGDPAKVFKIKEFVELDEISHAIYRNSSLILSRATAEIDAHTHAALIRNTKLSVHIPALEPGDITRLNSSRRSVNDLNQVNEFQIIGTPDSLINDQIDLIKYVGLKR